MDVQIINACNKNGDCVVYEQKEEENDIEHLILSEAQYFKWKILPKSEIADASTATVITSKIFTLFGIKWYFKLLPRMTMWSRVIRFYICIADLPPNVSEIAIYCKFTIKERNESSSHSLQFNNVKDCFKLKCSQSNESLQNIEELTFNLENDINSSLR